MSDRPYLISVDLGPVATAAMKELLAEAPKRTQSDLIRDCILIVHQFQLIGKLANQVDRAVTAKITMAPQKKRKTSDAEKEVIELYKEVYNYNGRIYWPPALTCIRACITNGLSYDVIKEIVRISINDAWIGQMMARGDRPQLHTILSEKVVASLLPKAQSSAEEDADRALLRLNGEIKPQALMDLKGCLPPEQYSQAWDLVNECITENDVHMVVKAAMEGTLKEYEEKNQSLIEALEDV